MFHSNQRACVGRALTLALFGFLASCASYAVPGRAADFSVFTGERGDVIAQVGDDVGGPIDGGVDGSVQDVLARQPRASFPVVIAVARVQAPDYSSRTIAAGHGSGAYTVIGVRDFEEQEDFERLGALPRVDAVVPVNRLLVPADLQSDLELRKVAAQLHADMLLVYTLDTTYEIDDRVNLFEVLSLGLLSDQKAIVRTTASALLLDSRSGFLYAVAEGTARAEGKTSVWNAANTVERIRRGTEREAFTRMGEQLGSAWESVVRDFSG